MLRPGAVERLPSVDVAVLLGTVAMLGATNPGASGPMVSVGPALADLGLTISKVKVGHVNLTLDEVTDN